MRRLHFALTASLVLAAVSLAHAVDTAPSSTEQVTVNVASVAELSVPPTVSLDLTPSGAGEATYAGTPVLQADVSGLQFTHNASDTKQICVEAVPSGANVANDITLALQVGDCSPVTLVQGGTPTGPQVAMCNVPAGGYLEDLRWTASASIAGTPAGAYSWNVVFTVLCE